MDRLRSGSGTAAMDRLIERPRGRITRRVKWAGAAIFALALIGLIYLLVPASDSLAVDGEQIQTGTVKVAPFEDYVPLRAEVVPLQTVYISAMSGGEVEGLLASDGQMVTKGEPLVRLRNPSLEIEVASQSADIAGQLSNVSAQRETIESNKLDAATQLATAKNDLFKAEHELRVQQTLFEKGIVNKAAVDPRAAEAAYQRQRVASLEAGLLAENSTMAAQARQITNTAKQLSKNLAMVQDSLDALTVRAPTTGRLTAFTLQPGQVVKAGDPLGQVDSEGAWKLTADVDQFYLGRVQLGQSAVADLDGREVPLRIIKILPQVNDGRFKVELGFDGVAPEGLNRGQTLDVRLTLGADHPAVVAPAGGWLDAGGTTAFVVNSSGNRADRRAITSGRRNPDQVEITAGVKPGERIVTSPIGTYATYNHLIIR